jgi:acetyl-CoA carboxylase biotin carboxyl carrier protein
MSPVSDDDISWLLDTLEQEDLLELEVEEEGRKVRVAKGAPPAVAAAPAEMLGAAAPPSAGAAQELPSDTVPVLSPMAGIFYRAPSPESPPYVEVGSHVERGDVVGLIEAMKIFNEIEAPVSGRVAKVLVQNQDGVQTDQRLMLLEVGDGEG